MNSTKRQELFSFNSTTVNSKNDCFFIIDQALNVNLMRQEMFDLKLYFWSNIKN